jgi:hypothetical protein
MIKWNDKKPLLLPLAAVHSASRLFFLYLFFDILFKKEIN